MRTLRLRLESRRTPVWARARPRRTTREEAPSRRPSRSEKCQTAISARAVWTSSCLTVASRCARASLPRRPSTDSSRLHHQRRQWSIPGHYRVDPEPLALPIASHEGDGAIPPPGGTVEVVAPRQADTPAVAPGGTHAATHGAATSPIDTTADRAEGAGGPAPATEGSPASLPKEKGLLARLSLRRKGRK